MKEKIVLLGGGGHCKVVIDAIRKADKYEIEGIVDPNLGREDEILSVPVLGGDNELSVIRKKDVKNAFVAVGSVGDCSRRRELFEKIKDAGFGIPCIIHPGAVIGEGVEVGKGTFVAARAVINPGTTIGDNVIINTSSSVDHDCRIGDHVHIAPGVTLSGNVEVEEGAHVGTGAKVTQCARITKGQKIKAGSLVYQDSDGITQIKEVS